MNLVSRFYALTWSERGLVIRTCFVVLLVRMGLSVLGYRTVHGLVVRSAGRVRRATAPRYSAERMAAAVRGVSRYIPRTACLPQALTAQWLLQREGYTPSFHLGVRRDGEMFEAHAWVECDGSVVIGGRDARVRYRCLPEPQAETS